MKYIEKLRQHRPVANKDVRWRVVIRWVAVVTCWLSAVLGFFLGFLDSKAYSISGWCIFVLSLGALSSLAGGWLARRNHGLNGQWGFAPLKGKEVEEFYRIANHNEDLGRVVDEWLEYCVENGANLRGVDMLILKKYAKKHLKNQGEEIPTLIEAK